ncbi:hypothetical protein MBGDN05_00840, partial [Thermoplasmatales archaeon SCGC AB-539-N05]
KTLKENDTPFFKLGETIGEKLVIKDNKNTIIDLKVNVLRDHWKNAIWNIMG